MIRINFVLLTFLGSNMLHIPLVLIEELNDFNEERFDDDSSDKEQVG